MPHLNWRNFSGARCAVTEISGSRGQVMMSLRLTASEREELYRELECFLEDPLLELRIDLPSNQALFFKLRKNEARLLVAHPNPGEWVATMAFDILFLEQLLGQLSNLKTQREIRLRSLGQIDRFSNFELVMTASEETSAST